MASDLAELLDQIAARGFTRDFSYDVKAFYVSRSDITRRLKEFHVVESIPIDSGTDPGDDATLFLIESINGEKGFIVISDSFHTDPVKASFISTLLVQRGKNFNRAQ